MNKLTKSLCIGAMAISSLFAHEHGETPSLSHQLGIEKYGELAGAAYLYYQEVDVHEGNEDDTFGLGRLDLSFTTAKWNGLQAGVTGVFNASLIDDKDAYTNIIADDAALAEAWVSYDITEKTNILAGRIAREWVQLDDYFEGVFIESDEIEGFNLKFTAVNDAAVYDIDEVTRWEKLNGEQNNFGVWGTEITYNAIEGLEATAVYYHSVDVADIYGTQIVYGFDISEEVSNETVFHAFKTDEDEAGAEDGGVIAIANTVSINDLSLTAGYFQFDEDGAAGSLLNNPWDPFFEDDKSAESEDSKNWYLQADYAVTEKFALTALYGESETDAINFRELNLIVAYEIIDSLALEASYVNLEATDESGYDLYYAQLSYEF